MSPIVARAAIRATRLAGQGQARQFSVMRTMRNVARSFEDHPFQRLPTAQTPQGADWGKQLKRVGGQAVVFFPAIAVMLGWPYLGYKGLGNSMGAL